MMRFKRALTDVYNKLIRIFYSYIMFLTVIFSKMSVNYLAVCFRFILLVYMPMVVRIQLSWKDTLLYTPG
jgi:hypothetical protein